MPTRNSVSICHHDMADVSFDVAGVGVGARVGDAVVVAVALSVWVGAVGAGPFVSGIAGVGDSGLLAGIGVGVSWGGVVGVGVAGGTGVGVTVGSGVGSGAGVGVGVGVGAGVGVGTGVAVGQGKCGNCGIFGITVGKCGIRGTGGTSGTSACAEFALTFTAAEPAMASATVHTVIITIIASFFMVPPPQAWAAGLH